MARVAIVSGGGEPAYSTNQGVIDGLKLLGHEVISIGPRYWDRNLCDIEVPDHPFPERYSYESVLNLLPWTPQLVLQVEPHFYLTGPKPPELKSCTLILDPHRGARSFRKLAEEGSFNTVFCAQKFYLPLFENIPNARTYYLPHALNPVRFNKEQEGEIRADLAFIGQHGLSAMEYPYEDDIGRFATHPPTSLPTDHRRFAFAENYSFEYAERAEILLRLCRDFHVRIYANLYDNKYQAALQAGAIIVQRSLRYDLTIRCFETMAANRLLICDAIPYQEELFQDNIHCRTYPVYGFNPLFDNFTIEYEIVRDLVKYYLNHFDEWDTLRKAGYELTWAKHTWESRAKELLEVALN